jgi:hypothetical protein
VICNRNCIKRFLLILQARLISDDPQSSCYTSAWRYIPTYAFPRIKFFNTKVVTVIVLPKITLDRQMQLKDSRGWVRIPSEKELIEVRMSNEVPSWEEPSNLEGRYANCFKVGYNAFELVIDFGQVSGTSDVARLTSRIVTNPRSAKALHEILGQTLEEYERTFGVIQEEED